MSVFGSKERARKELLWGNTCQIPGGARKNGVLKTPKYIYPKWQVSDGNAESKLLCDVKNPYIQRTLKTTEDKYAYKSANSNL